MFIQSEVDCKSLLKYVYMQKQFYPLILQIHDYFLSSGFLLWPALIWFIELSSIIKWRFSHTQKKAKEGKKDKLFIDLCCIFLHKNSQGYTVETVQDFLIKLDIKPLMRLLEISIFSLNNVIVRLTKIMNSANKNLGTFLGNKVL